MVDNMKSNPDVGVEMDYEPQVDNASVSRRLFPHVFPANTGAWSRFRGPLPQLGSVLNLIKPPRR